MDWTDRSTCVLFGDGAGAVLLEAAPGEGTAADGGYSPPTAFGRPYKDLLYVDGGVSDGHHGPSAHAGQGGLRHAVEKLAETAHAALDKAGLGAGDVDWIVTASGQPAHHHRHAQRMQVPMDRVVVTVQDHGNTSARRFRSRFRWGWTAARSSGRRGGDRGDRRRAGLGRGRPALVMRTPARCPAIGRHLPAPSSDTGLQSVPPTP